MEEERLALLEMKETTLKFYDWKNKSITFGHFIKSDEFLVKEALTSLSFDLAKRPTGGGIIFHVNDLSFSLLIPKGSPLFRENTLDSYRTVNELIGKALKEVFEEEPTFFEEKRKQTPFCMASPTIYDLLLFGKKIGGAAQRRTQAGVLHQTSLQLMRVDEAILKATLKDPKEVVEAMRDNSFSKTFKSPLKNLRLELKKSLTNSFSSLFSHETSLNNDLSSSIFLE
jgi:lipoate-protein ligase A